jgi:hypothetical protein
LGKEESVTGPHGHAVVLRGAQADPPARAVLAHEGDESAVLLADDARLDVAEPDHGLLVTQVAPLSSLMATIETEKVSE